MGECLGRLARCQLLYTVYPEAKAGGAIGKIENGDLLKLDCHNGSLELLVDAATLAQRTQAVHKGGVTVGMGREMFAGMRMQVSAAELGASTCV